MGRNLNQVLADVPAGRRTRIDARYREMKAQIDSLRELRRVAGKAQAGEIEARASRRASTAVACRSRMQASPLPLRSARLA